MAGRRSVWAGLLLLALVVAVAATIGTAPAAGSDAADSLTLVLDRFEANFNGVNGTGYIATVSSKDNTPPQVNWKMSYAAGRCGDFTVEGATVLDNRELVQEYSITPALNSPC